jgi:hypothetical protein
MEHIIIVIIIRYFILLPIPVAARFAAARLLGSRVRIPPGTWMPVCWECCVLSGRGLCDELIPSSRGVVLCVCDVSE